MNSPDRLSRPQRLARLAFGVVIVVGGLVVFSVSKKIDPDNRGALITIVMLIVGTGWIGQAIRGRRESAGVRELKPLPGPRVSADKTIVGLFAAWLIPGAGHWMLGQRQKAILYFTTITITLLIGIALARGRNFNYERDAVYFLAYAFNGAETWLAWISTRSLTRTEMIPHYQLGFLYSAVASLLNIVAMMDFLATAMRFGQAGGELAGERIGDAALGSAGAGPRTGTGAGGVQNRDEDRPAASVDVEDGQ